MDLPKQIETKRLILRPFNRDDFEVFSKIINDSEVSKNIKFVLKSELINDINAVFQSIIDSYSTSEPAFALIILNKESSTRIGICGLIPLENINNVECFYALLSRYRGQGFAIEAMKKLIEYAFSKLNLIKITAFINPKDSRLWKVAERIGMKYMGHIQSNNINSKAMVFTIEKSEYEIQSFY
jgi:RimJ/RimL family protein N-acetyltransferase